MINEEPKKNKILIVDDEVVILRLINRLLKSLPYELVLVESVAKGLDMVAKHDFQLLLTDLRLPDGNGVQVAKKFIEKNPSGKVIVMTGSLAQESHLSKTMNFVFHGFLAKPFELETLKSTVKKVLEEAV